eukprot:GHVT01040246.1.p2 GENE.GHVT01040246.1~~GHVT01040246.1.p2  ORF type:complete len:480 (+),score=38.07 GHVT01040246.1:3955-5394(+)
MPIPPTTAPTMKLKVIHRDLEQYLPTNNGGIQRYFKNPDPRLHPFEREREYARALVATKMDKMFAKPLISVLDGHTDAVRAIATSPNVVSDLFTGSCDGEVRLWDMSTKKCERSIRAHDGFVRGLCVSPESRWLFSCGDDKAIKQWALPKHFHISAFEDERHEDVGNLALDGDTSNLFVDVKPANVLQARSILTAIDHHQNKPLIASSGSVVDIWDQHRSSPLLSFEWGCDTIVSVKFSPSETHLIGATGADNAIGLYDIRGGSPVRKVVLQMRSNAICWNPMRPMNFTVANEDHNLYTFDLRKLTSAANVHRDFTNAVLDVSYSPTGEEFAAAGFDRTVRLFKIHERRSRDVYHARRMQAVLCCKYTGDARFVASGSADFCVRVWKSEASEALGPRSYRERQALTYRKALKAKYAHVKEIRRIAKHHHVPKLIKKTTEKKFEMQAARKRKEDNRIKHSKPGSVVTVPAKKKPIVAEVE